MADPVKFLCDVMGTDDSRHARHRPGSLLTAISAGHLALDPDLMKSSHGADVLNKLISTVCKLGIGNLNLRDENNKTPGATMMRYEKLVDRLVQAGVDPWMPGRDGESPWQLAIGRGWEGACLRFLQHPSCPQGEALGNGQNIFDTATERQSVDPWIVAASRHDMVGVLGALLKDATELNRVDFTGNSALHHGASPEAVQMLLAAGIDPEIRNRSGVSAEEKWIEKARRGDLDPKAAKKMAAALLFKRMEHGDPKTQAADLVAEAGQHMGVRDGEPLLKQAGWKDARAAFTSKGQTIFATRAEDAMNKGFRLKEQETFINAGDYTTRTSKIIAWLDKKNASRHDQGLERLLMWHLRAVDRNRGWDGQRSSEITSLETKLKLSNDISVEAQQKAIDALKDAVSRGAITNGSFVAGTALSGVLSQTPTIPTMFQSHEDRDPLLIQWLELVYMGMQDRAWHKEGAFSSTTRPDIALNSLFERLDMKTDFVEDEFWTHPKLPGLFLRLMGGKLAGNGKSSYFTPMTCTYEQLGASERHWVVKPAEAWIPRMDARALMAEVAQNPVSGRIFQALREHVPEASSLAEQAAIDIATPAASAPGKRRSL